jgi:hypothetical protein
MRTLFFLLILVTSLTLVSSAFAQNDAGQVDQMDTLRKLCKKEIPQISEGTLDKNTKRLMALLEQNGYKTVQFPIGEFDPKDTNLLLKMIYPVVRSEGMMSKVQNVEVTKDGVSCQ